MYIDGHLKGGFQTVEAYAGFCGYFKNWLDTKSIKLSVPRQGEMVAEDYRACLEYVNSEVSELIMAFQLLLNCIRYCTYLLDSSFVWFIYTIKNFSLQGMQRRLS